MPPRRARRAPRPGAPQPSSPCLVTARRIRSTLPRVPAAVREANLVRHVGLGRDRQFEDELAVFGVQAHVPPEAEVALELARPRVVEPAAPVPDLDLPDAGP